jgi:hypothetical protein
MDTGDRLCPKDFWGCLFWCSVFAGLSVSVRECGLQLSDPAPQSLLQLVQLVAWVGLQLCHSLPVGQLLELPSLSVSLILGFAKRAGPVFALLKRDEHRGQSASHVIQRVLAEDNDCALGCPSLEMRQEPVARGKSTEFAASEERTSR